MKFFFNLKIKGRNVSVPTPTPLVFGVCRGVDVEMQVKDFSWNRKDPPCCDPGSEFMTQEQREIRLCLRGGNDGKKSWIGTGK